MTAKELEIEFITGPDTSATDTLLLVVLNIPLSVDIVNFKPDFSVVLLIYIYT